MYCHSLYVTGASHLVAGKPCQDRTHSYQRCYAEDKIATVLVVSDGHGHPSHFRSERGAALALDATAEALDGLLPLLDASQPGEHLLRAGAGESCGCADVDSAMRDFFADFLRRWYGKILNDCVVDPHRQASLSAPVRAYGCTLVGAVACAGFWFSFQIGDGACAAMAADGSVFSPVPDDPRCRNSVTTSMCAGGADDFRFAMGAGVPPLMMICSDGLADSFGQNEGIGAEFMPELLDSLKEYGFDETCRQLARLLPGISGAGSRDDIGLAFWTELS